jgi:predicted GNAT family acetyltransferase
VAANSGGVDKSACLSERFAPFLLDAQSGNKEDAMNLQRRAVRQNVEKSRFELPVDGEVALADYVLRDGVMLFTHTETPPALQGRGIASALIEGALLSARQQGLKVRASCSFVVDYLARHPEFADLQG